MAVLGVALAGGVVAAVLVAVTGSTPRSRGAWWLAALLAPVPVGLAAVSDVPVAAVAAGIGLAAAAVVDAAELRIPTRLAVATFVASSSALVAQAAATSSWDLVARAGLGTAVVVLVFAALWVAGGMGYGDVRLGAAATPSVAAAGLVGVTALLWGAFLAGGATALVLRAASRSSRSSLASRPVAVVDPLGSRARSDAGRAALSIPFGPAIAAGWLLAVVLT